MLFPQQWSSSQRITTSGVIGTSGAPLIFYGYSVMSGAGGVAKPYFINGATGSGSTVFVADPSSGAVSTERTIPLPVGTMFNQGVYVSFDANTSAVTVFYTQAS